MRLYAARDKNTGKLVSNITSPGINFGKDKVIVKMPLEIIIIITEIARNMIWN